jgi:hypothetical protein
MVSIIQQWQVKLSGKRKMANVDNTQRKNQLIPFVKSPIEFFFIKILKDCCFSINIKKSKTK